MTKRDLEASLKERHYIRINRKQELENNEQKNENLQIRVALDNVTTNVMMADKGYENRLHE